MKTHELPEHLKKLPDKLDSTNKRIESLMAEKKDLEEKAPIYAQKRRDAYIKYSKTRSQEDFETAKDAGEIEIEITDRIYYICKELNELLLTKRYLDRLAEQYKLKPIDPNKNEDAPTGVPFGG